MSIAKRITKETFSDAELVTLLCEDNRWAFSEIYNRYWNSLYRLAYQKLRLREAAEEITQDLFISLWTKRHEAKIVTLKAYLFAALRFSIIDFIEAKMSRERFIICYESFMDKPDVPVPDELEFQDLRNSVELCLIELPEKSQEIFRLSRFESLSVKEIALKLGLTEKAIEYHLTKALRVVRKKLEEMGAAGLLFFFIYYK